MLSFAPATRTFGCAASTARAGSFCLFWENGLVGLPAVTIASGLNAATVPARLSSTETAMLVEMASGPLRVRNMDLLLNLGRVGSVQGVGFASGWRGHGG